MNRKLIKTCIIGSLLCCTTMITVFAQNITITVNANQGKRPISPNIYGRNESFDHTTQFYKDAGLRFARVGGGNNMSAYNWRQKLTVHPDWFNNVYGADWDVYAQKINDNFTNMQGMFAFQLLGRAASSGQYNFGDWEYMQAHPGWQATAQNLAGGGTPDPSGGSKALVDGDINLFSKPWPADSSVGILTHWFGVNGLGLNKDKFVYWDMDNEVDVWNGTHDWAMPTLISASAFMDRYIELAKKAKALYPGIKLCGPVTTSEWQWYKWSNESIWINGKYYPWIRYFIKRLADEYKATGIKLVDVIDIHNYPYYNNDAQSLQGHRIYYDTNYNYPGANGIYSSQGGWNTSLKQEYIFKRFNDWLNEEFGPNHGISVGLSEWSPGPNEPNYTAVIYASHLGTFANNGVELFTPWNWFNGMWETLHLFSRYGKEFSIQSVSSLEDSVSAYSSINANADSMTIILVNRSIASQQNISVKVANMPVFGIYNTLSLYNLPSTETFVSHTNNALKPGTISVFDSTFTATLPPLSVTAVILKKNVQPISIKASKNPVCQGDNNITYSIPKKQEAQYKWTYSGTGVTIDNDTLNAIQINFSNTATSGTLTVNAKYPADSTWTFDITVGKPVAQPSIIISGKEPVCKGDNNITYSVDYDPALVYNWTYSGTGATILNGNTNSISINYGSTATGGTLTVTASNGCSNSRAANIIVNSLPAQPSIISYSKNPVCLGDSGINYSVTNDPTVTYNWTYSGNGATISNTTTNMASITYNNTATSGNIKVVATNAGGCSNFRTMGVTVNTPPAQPSVITASKNPVCQGATGIYYSVTSDPLVTYNWSYSGTGATIFFGNTNKANINYSKTATSGTLKVTVANSSGCIDTNTNNRTFDVILNNLPTPGAIVASKNPVIQGDNGITYSVIDDLSSTYKWTYSGTGATILNSTTSTTDVDYSSSATSGNMSVTVSNTSGCKISNIFAVTVNPQPTSIKNINSNDVFNCIFNSGKSEVQISYYLATADLVKIDLFNLQGKLIKHLEDSFKVPGNYDIHTSTNGLVKGVYIIRYSAGKIQLQKKILIIE